MLLITCVRVGVFVVAVKICARVLMCEFCVVVIVLFCVCLCVVRKPPDQ